MNSRSAVLVTLMGALAACSSKGATTDGGPGDGGAGEAGNSDAETPDRDIGDASDVSTGVPDAQRQALCDGEAHLRLWVLSAGRDDREAMGSQVRIENGSPFITIDGTCSYWVGAGWSETPLSRDRPIRTGKLSEADARAIEESVPLGDFAPLGDCPGPPGGLVDYDIRVIRAETTIASCPGTTGARFDAAWTTLQTIAVKLWENGTPMEGPIRVSAVLGSLPPTPSSPPAYPWAIALPLSSFVLDSAVWFQRGVSRLVDDLDLARQLRAMRDQYLADRTAQPGLYVSWDGLIAADQNSTAIVYMRDAIPYEDAQGLLQF